MLLESLNISLILLTSQAVVSAINVMQSTKMSLELVKFNFHFSDRLYASFKKLPFTTDPIEICQLVLEIQEVVGLQNTIGNKKYLLCLVISYNQYCKFQLILLDHK